MRIRTLAALGAMTALASAAPALAQDVAQDVWTGPYIGGSLGYNWQPNSNANRNETFQFDSDGDGVFDDTLLAGGNNAFAKGFCNGKGVGRESCTNGDRDGKTSWAVHAGYDLQMGNIVVGGVVEGGRSYGSNYVTGLSGTPHTYTFTRRLDWEGAARLRAGYSFGRTLVYGTGGLAYGKFKNSFETTNNPSVVANSNDFTVNKSKEDDWGYTYGGGIEHKVSDNFSIGVLYRYTRFDPNDFRVTATQGDAAPTNPFVNGPAGQTVIKRSNDRYSTQSVRATASFRF